MRIRLRGLGLRARVTLGFAVGALVLSALLAALTYLLARGYFLHQRQDSARRQAYVNARLVQQGLRPAAVDVPTLLTSLQTPADSQVLVYREGHWYTTSVAVAPDNLPAALRQQAMAGIPVEQLFSLSGTPSYAVALPIPAVDSTYFEVFSLSDLESTLRSLTTALIAAAGVTALAGAALGWWSSAALLAPLRAVSGTAREIAGGRLAARLDESTGGELATLARSFNAMVDALAARIERDARFASDVSHELRSPLTTLATAVAVLERRSAHWSDTSRQALALVSDELGRFQRLVSDLLEMARSDAGVGDPPADEVLLAELVRRVVAARVGEQVPVCVAADCEHAVLRLDKRRMERVIANLLENATYHGGGVVGVAVAREGGCARIEVDDAGPGIAPGDRERIFERFARGSAVRADDSGGSGLGLALVVEHVRAHGGRVWVQDRPGGGSRFIVEIPAVAP